LIASGLDNKNFQFIGFLPVNVKDREEILEEIKFNKNTLIFYEAPHKLLKTLESMLKVLGNRKVVLAKELTKLYETFYRANLESMISDFVEEEKIRGEFVILVEGSNITKTELQKEELLNLSLEEHFEYYANQGLDKKEVIKKIAKDRNVNKNEIYQEFI